MNEIPTPETDAAEMCVKHTHRMLYDEDKVVESHKMRNLERRLTVAREAMQAALTASFRGQTGRAHSILDDAMTQTAPKQ